MANITAPELRIAHWSIENNSATFNVDGSFGVIEGSRTVLPTATPGRVQDTWDVLYYDRANVTRSALAINNMVETVQRLLNLAPKADPYSVRLQERNYAEENLRSSRIYSGTIVPVDGIADWQLRRGARVATITIERDEAWEAEEKNNTVTWLSVGDKFAARDSVFALKTGGSRPGRVDVLGITPRYGNLREVHVGFKNAINGPLQDETGWLFDPHIEICTPRSLGIPGSSQTSVITDSAYWRSRVLKIGFDGEASFRHRAKCEFRYWNNYGARYEHYVGSYRVVGRVTFLGTATGATYNIRLGLAWGQYFDNRQGITWLTDNYHVRNSSNKLVLLDYGPLTLPGGPIRASAGRLAAHGNPLLVLGAGLVSGDPKDAAIYVQEPILVPTDYYVRLGWPGGVKPPYYYEVLGGTDGQALAHVRNSGGYFAGVTDITVGDNGLYVPYMPGSCGVVVTETAAVDVELKHRIRRGV